jgi:thioredoxin 1
MGKLVLIDFYADWCGPCKMQDPIMEELKKKFGDRVEFRKINVDDNMELSIKYEIRAVPTLVLEKDGILLKRYIGVTRGHVLEADLNSALK